VSTATEFAEEGGKMRRRDLLFVFDEDRYTDGQSALPGLQNRRVYRYRRPVVRRSAAEKTSAAYRRLEWWLVPQLIRAGRLNVVMGIHEYGGRSSWSRNRAEDRRMRPVHLEHPDSFEPAPLQPRRCGLRRSPYLIGPETVRANRRYPDEVLELSTNIIKFRFDLGMDG
jgi:hypothetical protein